MSVDQIKALIHRANDEILNKGNLDFADQAFDKDYVLNGTKADVSGPEYIRQFAAALRIAFPGTR